MESVMTRAALQAVIERYLEAWQRRDPAAIARCHQENGIVESPMYATLRGRKAIEEAMRAFFTSFPDATVAVESLLIDPPRVALFTTVNATHMKTNTALYVAITPAGALDSHTAAKVTANVTLARIFDVSLVFARAVNRSAARNSSGKNAEANSSAKSLRM